MPMSGIKDTVRSFYASLAARPRNGSAAAEEGSEGDDAHADSPNACVRQIPSAWLDRFNALWTPAILGPLRGHDPLVFIEREQTASWMAV